MGPKKGKGKDKKEDAPQEESEYAIMDLEMLKELVPMLRQQVEKNVMDRNYVQLERVSIYYLLSTYNYLSIVPSIYLCL